VYTEQIRIYIMTLTFVGNGLHLQNSLRIHALRSKSISCCPFYRNHVNTRHRNQVFMNTTDSDTVDEKYSDSKLYELAQILHDSVEIKTRRYLFQFYPNCFTGEDACRELVRTGCAKNDRDAIAIGKLLVKKGYIHHVTFQHDFENQNLFYVFTSNLKSQLENVSGKLMSNIWPNDELNWKLVEQVGREACGKTGVVNPRIDSEKVLQKEKKSDEFVYDLIVIGAGSGGLVSAAVAAGGGAKVAIIEKNLLGGDCLNTGCVPSKSLISIANSVQKARDFLENSEKDPFHIVAGDESVSLQVDFGNIMKKVRKIRADIAKADSVERFANSIGVDIYHGTAKFTSKSQINVDLIRQNSSNSEILEEYSQILTFRRCIIASGASPRIPSIPGVHKSLVDTNPTTLSTQSSRIPLIMTSKSIFNLEYAPKKLVVIGSGPIAIELAQAFQRIGCSVTVLGRSGKILGKEDRDVGEFIEKKLRNEGVSLCLDVTEYIGVTVEDDESSVPLFSRGCVKVKRSGDLEENFEFDGMLLATGRVPNVDKLQLDKAGIEFDTKNGILIDEFMNARGNSSVFAVGDVAKSKYKFTHSADFMARAVVRNALFFGTQKLNDLVIPRTTYCDPEVASVGLNAAELKANGIEFDVYEKFMSENDRAICEQDMNGFVRIYTKKNSDVILGCTIVGRSAGDLIHEVTFAMSKRIGLGEIANVIHSYPTRGDAVRGCGDLYNKTKLTNLAKSGLSTIVKLRRSL